MAHLRFRISYRTEWGERLYLHYTLTNGTTQLRLPLDTTDGNSWTGRLDLESGTTVIYYNYCVCRESGEEVRREQWQRTLTLRHRTRLLLDDGWDDGGIHPALLRSAFTECVFRPTDLEVPTAPYGLTLHAVPPPPGRHWAVSGGTSHLGAWKPEKAVRLFRTGVYEWGIPLTSSDFSEGSEYKYLLVDDTNPSKVEWEEGCNRRICPVSLEQNEAAQHSDASPRFQLPPWRGAGVVIPVFSLRSEGSFGIGDFGDLKHLVAWAAQTGLRAIQLLPINDTTTTGTWRDSYPYSAISVFALHPIYLDMRWWDNSTAYKKRLAKGQELNALPELDYENVFREKMDFLRELFSESGSAVLKTPRYKEFCKENRHWLPAYCRFCRLRDEHGTADFRTWPEKSGAEQPAPKRQRAEEDFYSYVQYLLHRQMSTAHEYARERGVILKGDIPIGICRDSVPAWADGHLFHFDGQAGAPPDAFARHGQNWGFPTYNWEEMQKDGYGWWRKRFQHMGRYFDAYRIDHVLGFFRIWEIPYRQVHGLLGRFRPALPLTEEEIRNAGFTASVRELAHALLTEERLEKLAEEVNSHGLRRFFKPCKTAGGAPRYELKPEYATGRDVLAATGDETLRRILLDVMDEVLFIEDPDRPGSFHPRIGAQETWRFACLSEADRSAFNRLHDDFFYFRHNQFWADEAMKKLPAIINTESETPDGGAEAPLLPCAEDLGMVPASVKGVLERLNVLSLEIQRMPKRYGVRFDDLSLNPWLSVATIATHDMPPFRLWWSEGKEQRQAFWRDVLHREGEAPEEALPDVCEQVVSLHLESPSLLCLLAMQDLLAIDGKLRRPDPAEQINVPANPDQYWRYRMHLTIEDLMAATGFNEKLRGLIMRSGRSV